MSPPLPDYKCRGQALALGPLLDEEVYWRLEAEPMMRPFGVIKEKPVGEVSG